jgi:thiamine biosynthesis lipoprotein
MTALPALTPDRTDLELELTTHTMGGLLRLRLACEESESERATLDLQRTADRIDAWASNLSRFHAGSALLALNAVADATDVPLRPTLAAVLSHARTMATLTEGVVDITLLDERLAAETGTTVADSGPSSWWLHGGGRRLRLGRRGHVRFDLDGVAKGWIADRALRSLDAYSDALVDADGDVALRLPKGSSWRVAVADPVDQEREIACLAVPVGWPALTMGVATSGTVVHSWDTPAGPSHHLIDPLTRRPAHTDVVQATVVAESAASAECLAKAAVIRGSQDGLGLIDRAGAWAAVLVLDGGDVVASPRTSAWLV